MMRHFATFEKILLSAYFMYTYIGGHNGGGHVETWNFCQSASIKNFC